MSSFKEHAITCPNCGAQGKFTAWDSVNVDIMPEMKEKVMSGELFRWICPECGESFTVPYPMLYHDMTKRFMVYHLLERVEMKPLDDSAEGLAKDVMKRLASNGFMNNGYVLRSSYRIDDFREKIAQLDSGLDDRVIEFLKYYLLHHDESKKVPDGAVLRFARAAEDEETGGLYLLFYIVHPSLPNQPFLQVSSNAYHEIEKAGKLDAIFGNQNSDYPEISQDYMAEVLGNKQIWPQ